jgi:hypothetical protein
MRARIVDVHTKKEIESVKTEFIPQVASIITIRNADDQVSHWRVRRVEFLYTKDGPILASKDVTLEVEKLVRVQGKA